MLDHIPLERPVTPLLDRVNLPAHLREMEEEDLPKLAEELRKYLLFSVGQTGGHFGAGLGVVELTIALHYVLNTPQDKLVWDVGHQTYPHKILTGRRDDMASIRQSGGLAGFPKRAESPYDSFGVGHSSTSISAALGMAVADKTLGRDAQSVAVIGDGAMTAGMAFEALNHATDTGTNILVVLNDNNMSISKNVGGLANYFSKIWASKTYTSFREGGKKVLNKMPSAREIVRKTEEHMKGLISPATLFEELGFYYVGPIDGHDLARLTHDIRNMLSIKGPKLLHVITQKGKGFSPAEDDPVGYHALNKIEPKAKSLEIKEVNTKKNIDTTQNKSDTNSCKQKYQNIFGQWLCDIARDDHRTIGITPAMCEGSGMVKFSEEFPTRYFDVAIAEQHAVTFAAGLACENLKPVVAIYSTFLQRAYDQLIHDVAIQNLDVTFAIDRAGLVGEDGPTHAGAFDLSFMRCIPNMIIATPSNENECRQLLFSAYHHNGPSAVRYPRGTGNGATVIQENSHFEIGKGQVIIEGKKVCILNFGALLDNAQAVAQKNNYTLCDMRWAKPIDTQLIQQQLKEHKIFVTLEDNAIAGGAGSAVNEFICSLGLSDVKILNLGLPDNFDDHGKREELLKNASLDEKGIELKIKTYELKK